MPILAKPLACVGCSLYEKGTGFVPPDGPPSAPLLFLGESAGATEVHTQRPFTGDAGGMLQRLLNLQGWTRDNIRIGNTISCRPPNDWLGGTPQAPWFHSSIDHCKVHRDPILAEGHKVVVTLGNVALQVAAGLLGQRKIRINDFHGSILKSPSGQLICPTFHPSFLQRGAHNLIGTVLWDLQQAEKAILHGQPTSDHTLIVDPPLDWFHAWVSNVIAMRQQDPFAYPISSDIETPDKAGGKDEGEITAEDRSFIILRVNVSCHPDEGVTVPFVGGYIEELRRLHQSPGEIWTWNGIGYDFERLVASDMLKEADFPRVIDLMWYWHRLQSDLPRGLGFVAPFYSAFGTWKHKADSEPAWYGAVDGLQNHRVGFGVIGDLQKTGQYDTTRKYVHELMYKALRPAQIIGVQIDRPALLAFKADLGQKATRLLDSIAGCVPDELLPLTPKQGLTRKPLENVLHVKATAFTRKGKKRAGKEASEIKLDLYKKAVVVERDVNKDVLVCAACGTVDVQRRHRCADKASVAAVSLETRAVTRWYWQEPFNPDSPDQVLAYIKFRKHQPGRAKKSQADSTNKETLKKLTRTGDPFYAFLLDYRAVVKVKGTYVDGTERRLDSNDRIHPEPTFRPSTGRLCIAKGTPVDIVRNVEEFPRGIPIEDVNVGDWAYTYDAQRQLTLRKVVWAGQTGVQAVVRVHWAGSQKRKERGFVDLTPEHEVRLTTGEYKRAGELVYGDRILSLARFLDRGYVVLNPTGHEQVREHRFIQRVLTGKAGDHVHHKNERTADNRPENLVNMTAPRHRQGHTAGSKNPRWRHDWPEQDPVARRKRGYAEYRARHNNHRILLVEKLSGVVPVYDLEVEGTHNFIANEICVHNSYANPNITNVVADKGGKDTLAAGFRKCVVAVASSRLLEVDFAGSEAVDFGWWCRDPAYIRLANLGVHSGLASHVLKRPYNPGWSDRELGDYFKAIKKSSDQYTLETYDRCKRFVHGFSYGLTTHGMVLQFPEIFPTLKIAEQYAEIFMAMAPKAVPFHRSIRELAFKQHYLGGPGVHPFGDKHWFWSVFTYKKITSAQYWKIIAIARKKGWNDDAAPVANFNGQYFRINLGEDGKRCVAFLPQSTTAGKLKECMLRLFDPASPSYIGSIADGLTPLRAPIHDSLLLEIPSRVFELVAETVFREMQRPFEQMPMPAEWGLGSHLATGISAKTGLAGGSWASMEDLTVPRFEELGVGSDRFVSAPEDDQQEDLEDFAREIA